MLSDEEREALQYFNTETKTEAMHYGAVLVKLIEKKSKEIEELKEKNRQSKMRIVQLENEITARIEDVNQYYTPNEKIKEEIKDLKLECENCPYKGELCDELNSNNNCVPGMTILILQSLLEKE